MVRKLKSKITDQRGAIVVEASISLTAFMFFIVIILSVVNICYAQAKIGVAVNSTAKEISEYSYLYDLVKLREKQAELYAGAKDTVEQVDTTLDSVDSVFSSVDSIGQNISNLNNENFQDSFNSIQGDTENIKTNVAQIQTQFESVFDDPKAFVLGIAKIAGNQAIETVKSRLIAAPVSKLFCMKHLTTESTSGYQATKENCNKFLKKLGIEPSEGSYIDGLDFTDSVLFLNGSTDIMVIVHYKVKVLTLLGNDITLSFTQCGTTRGWVPISERKAAQTSESSNGDEEKKDEEESTAPTEAKKTVQDYLDDFLVQPSSNDAFIGVVSEDDKNSANRYGASYLIIDSSLTEQVKNDLGSNGMTQIYKGYIDDRLAKGARFMCASDPATAKDPYFKQQVKYLKSKGYNFKYNEALQVYIAEKN